MGLVRRFTKPNLPVYARLLSVAELEQRIARCYLPYHAMLQGICDRLHGKFGAVWLVNCHSMPARGNAMSSDGPNARVCGVKTCTMNVKKSIRIHSARSYPSTCDGRTFTVRKAHALPCCSACDINPRFCTHGCSPSC